MRKYIVTEIHPDDAFQDWQDKIVGKIFLAKKTFTKKYCTQKGYWHGELISPESNSYPMYFYAVKAKRVY